MKFYSKLLWFRNKLSEVVGFHSYVHCMIYGHLLPAFSHSRYFSCQQGVEDLFSYVVHILFLYFLYMTQTFVTYKALILLLPFYSDMASSFWYKMPTYFHFDALRYGTLSCLFFWKGAMSHLFANSFLMGCQFEWVATTHQPLKILPGLFVAVHCNTCHIFLCVLWYTIMHSIYVLGLIKNTLQHTTT